MHQLMAAVMDQVMDEIATIQRPASLAAGPRVTIDVVVDVALAQELGLAGKRGPNVFPEVTRRPRVAPRQAVVLEDALAGVAAGRAGDLGRPVGVDRTGQAAGLRASGADVRTGTVIEHERALDLRSGLLVRSLRWHSPAGHEVTLRTRRLVSLEYPELAAVEYDVETADSLRLSVHSELTTEVGGLKGSADPRSGVGLAADTLVPRLAVRPGARALLVHRTSASRVFRSW